MRGVEPFWDERELDAVLAVAAIAVLGILLYAIANWLS